MTVSIITEGLLSSSTPDASPPVVSAITPSTNTPPGSGGGMPLNYAVAKGTAVVIQITDSDGASNVALVNVSAVFLDGTAEAIYSAGSFLGDYVAGSSQTSATNGIQLTIERGRGWPAAPAPNTPLAVGIRVTAVDFGGNITTTTLYYQMPLASTLAPAAQVAPIVSATNLAAEIVSHIVWQLRS